MPRQGKTAGDESRSSALADTVEQSLASICITTQPVVIVGVNRRVNLGNYEHLDLYAGLALPTGVEFDEEKLRDTLNDIATLGFQVASQQTGQRYEMLKAMRGGGRADSVESATS